MSEPEHIPERRSGKDRRAKLTNPFSFRAFKGKRRGGRRKTDDDRFVDKYSHRLFIALIIILILCAFDGVATIVTKLFHIVMPTVAVFGEKDFQQLVVIRRMVADLNMNLSIIAGPTVREADGLAMSSRNVYLRPGQREAALSLYRSLNRARERVRRGCRDVAELVREAGDFVSAHPETAIDYIAVVDIDTLADVERVDGPARMAMAGISCP